MSFQLNLNIDTLSQCHLSAPLCLAPESSLRDVLRQMREHNCGVVLVCDAATIVGIFTERDALKLMAAPTSLDAPLRQFMTPNPVVLRITDRVGKAISTMSRGGYRRLPIVDDQDQPTGMVTAEGIMHYLAEHFSSLIYNLPPEPHHCAREREGA